MEAARKKESDAHHRKLTAVLDVGFILYVTSGGDVCELRMYLHHNLPEGAAAEVDDFVHQLEQRFLETELNTLSKIADSQSPPFSTQKYRRASRAREELGLLDWIRTQNDDHGVAPSSSLLWDQKTKVAGEKAESSTAVPHAAGPTKSAQIKWAQRFRARWKLQMVRPVAQHVLPPEQLQQKV